jgi:hypothetical protein
MTLKSYLWGIRIGTILSLLAFVLVLFNVDPQTTGISGQLIFYISSFLVLSGVFVLFFSWSRLKWSNENESASVLLALSFRQGILLAILCVAILAMQSLRILTWWDGLLVLAGILLVELYFLARK